MSNVLQVKQVMFSNKYTHTYIHIYAYNSIEKEGPEF